MAKKEIEVKKDVYKEALIEVLRMLQSGVHVESIIKYIKKVIDG